MIFHIFILFINYSLISNLTKSLLEISSRTAPIKIGITLIHDITMGAISNV